jgi:hypothetical protein
LRDNLGWLIGSIVTVAAMVVSWLVSSGIFTTLLAVLVGAGITYFVQTRTQKKTQEREWKREHTLEIIEKIYGPLFEEIDNLLRYMRMEIYEMLSTPKWWEIQSTYRYLMLDEDFKKKTKQLYEKVETFNKTLTRIKREVLDTIVKEEAEEFLRFQPKTLDLVVKGIRFNEWTSMKVEIPTTLLKRKQPIEMVSDLYPELKKPSFYLEIISPSGNPYSYTHPEWMKEFDKFWKRSSSRLEADPIVKTLRKQYNELIQEMEKIRKELETRIQRQWKV